MKRTPIEIAIDGDQASVDRRARYAARQRARGLQRVIVTVPEHQAETLKAFAAELRRKDGFQ